ncbi:aldo/keto reductase [Hoeflea prorocentri]|uniref:Aldo/keto reductase n=1 Tax=Hoeflea prorocentri TaxID=1922333 RepID=A0A9X3UM96_9HYPH|nr:aldo/keto reductase [Hoeflea prorocentri]MCY6383242.1 aldo/keto reductase [Hoeflea prorocentri]MDA5401042.1 aldo/keto reductase [Hoeflea prorocentri]
MDYRILGRTGVDVSRLCFGTMSFGGDADAKTAASLFAACRERGINFFDCARIYNDGRSEDILGDLIASERDELVITSKFGYRLPGSPASSGTSRRHAVLAVEQSLKLLKTDRLDILFIHHWDAHTPLEESLRALDDLVSSGKVLYLGASNFAAWQVAKALGISARNAWSRFDVIQPMYNLVKRQAEVEILPMALSEELGVITYSPLGGGLLTGKYAGGAPIGIGRLADDARYAARYGQDWMAQAAIDFCDFAKSEGYSPVSLAIAWVAAHPAVTAPIIGGRSVDQIKPSLDALDIDMTPDLYQRIAAFSPAPPPATDRSEEAGGQA